MSPSWRGPSCAGSRRSATRSPQTSRCSRSPPTRWTPNSAPASGTLLEIRVLEDETAEVGATLGVIGEPSAAGAEAPPAEAPQAEAPQAEAAQPEAAPQEAPAAPAEPEPAAAAQPSPAEEPASQAAAPAPAAAHGGAAPSDLYVTPLVRKLAAQSRRRPGRGQGHRRRRADHPKQDVFDATHQATATTRPGRGRPRAGPGSLGSCGRGSPPAAPRSLPRQPRSRPRLARLRPHRRLPASPAAARQQRHPHREDDPASARSSPSRMVDSLRVSAQLTTVIEADVTLDRGSAREAQGFSFEAREGVKLSFMPFFAKATVEALKQFPCCQRLDGPGGRHRTTTRIHLGIAVDTERASSSRSSGMPTTSTSRVSAARSPMSPTHPHQQGQPGRAVRRHVHPDDTGSRGALFDTPIINQPQVAILGIGAIVPAPSLSATTPATRSLCAHGLPGADLRPPPGGRRRRRSLPDRAQAAPGGRGLRGRAGLMQVAVSGASGLIGGP